MIPFFRSLSELMLITQPRDQYNKDSEISNLSSMIEDSGQRKRYIRSKDKNSITLPSLPKVERRKWTKGKEVVSRFFDELDYNSHIQSSYDITLIESQNNCNDHDVA